MLRLNQNLINLSKQEEVKKQQIEAILKQAEQEQELLKAIEDKKQAEKLADENWLKARLENFKRQFAAYFNRTQYKFTADVSEDGEFIETFTQGKVLIGKYGKDANGRFKPIELTISGINKQEDLDYSSMKPQIYALLESTFK